MAYIYYECTKCGEITTYKPEVRLDGSILFIHEMERTTFPFPHNLITKSCETPPMPKRHYESYRDS